MESLDGDELLIRALGRVLEAWPDDREAQSALARLAARAEVCGNVALAIEAHGLWARHGGEPSEPRAALARLALELSSGQSHAAALRALELLASPGRGDVARAPWEAQSIGAAAQPAPTARASGDIAAALRSAQAQLAREDRDALAANLGQLVRHAPPEWGLERVVRPLRRAATPGIFLCTLPKSGSVYVHQALSRGLDKPMLQVGAGGFFPHQAIAMGCIQQLHQQRAVYMIHSEPSRHNRIELSARLDRMVIQVRDPRQTLLSWAHFIPEVVRRLDPPQGLHYGVPSDLFERPFVEQVDWHIESYLPIFVAWMQGWIACAEDPEFKTQVLFVTNEELARDPHAFFTRILDFYGIDPALFDMPAAPQAGDQNVRSGQTDEWRTELTPEQQRRCSERIPPELCRRFAWPIE